MAASTEESERSVPLTVQNQIEGIDQITDEDERYSFHSFLYIHSNNNKYFIPKYIYFP